jgi:acyl carrier protein
MNKKILDFICQTTFVDPQKINDRTLLFDEGIFDSLGLLNLITFLEKDFNVKVDDSELDAVNFESIKAIESFLEKKLCAG